MKKKHMGYCHICGKYGKLTFEHIPPKCALNDKKSKAYTGDSLIRLISEKNKYPWEREGIKYKTLQRGFGDYTLCSNCNNLTGALYGEEFAKWFYSVLEMIRINPEEYKKSKSVQFSFKDVYPGRFIRQILSIICSTYPDFTKNYPFVKDLILDKNYKHNDIPSLKIYMYLLKNTYTGYTGVMGMFMKNGTVEWIDEIDIYPFGFYLCLSGQDKEEIDITKFINYGYDEKAVIDFSMNIHEKNNLFPT